MSSVCRRFSHPLALALLLALANAAKPVAIDDTAYLLFARHLAAHPLDPYGFDLFWYDKPEPAMTILLPPVLPYWLALGVAVFGEQPFLLKLWLFPFAAVLAYAARPLVRRFVARDSPLALAVLVIGPGVLPFFNIMLDVPALAFQLAAVALFLRGVEGRRNWRFLAAAGACVGLALQTKYSVLGLPAVLLALGFFRHRFKDAVAVVALGAVLFLAWEAVLFAKYGESHFVHHLMRKAAPDRIGDWVGAKLSLAMPLLSHLGLTAGWVGIIGLRWWHSARLAGLTAALGAIGFSVVVFLPAHWQVLMPVAHEHGPPLTIAAVLFPLLGGLALAVGTRFAAILVLKNGITFRRRWESRFLACWLVLELASYFALTPFPAGRRVIGVTFVLAVVVLRAWERFARRDATLRSAKWIFTLAMATGIATAALDAWDAQPERALPRQAAAFARERGWSGQGYFVGHWGFQYYAGREGMRLIEPDRTRLRPGDWVVLPIYPDAIGFYRPHHGEADVVRNAEYLSLEMETVWEDCLHVQTVPNLYGGRTPITTRFHPRLRVGVYRVTAAFVPARAVP